MKFNYSKILKNLSQNLRNKSTISEVLPWNKIKGKSIKGYQFYRQKPFNNYIVDFYCRKLKLVIEIEGESHNEKIDEDNIRQEELEKLGLRVIRFSDINVKRDIDAVIRTIEKVIDELEEDELK